VTPTWPELFTRRALLVTGKGGVGKTTIAVTLARGAAAAGKRVLCAEVGAEDEASSPLARAFGGEGVLAEEPALVAEGIRGVLLTPTAGHRQFLRETLKVRFLADAALRSAAIRSFLRAAPTFAEMGVLYRFLHLLRQQRPDGSPEHEVVIVDLPATGHALGFVQFPAALLKLIPGGPVGAAVREGLAVITDPARTAALVVTLPESLPVSESIELTRGLLDAAIPVAAVVLNRVCGDPFADDERAAVDRFVAQHWPILGARSLRRIDAAKAATRRLGEELPLPVLIMEESPEDGCRVPVDLAARAHAEPRAPAAHRLAPATPTQPATPTDDP
jgi:arsenite/tail-anchored protein-transporting ATPase